jgi:hypothetical protein
MLNPVTLESRLTLICPPFDRGSVSPGRIWSFGLFGPPDGADSPVSEQA